MKETTEGLLEKLGNAEWFTNVGREIKGNEVATVQSWKEAMTVCESKTSHFVTAEAANVLTERLHYEARERYRLWNKIVLELKRHTIPLVESKTAAVAKRNKLPKAFKGQVDWDILHACMELEYADIVPPRFFDERARWYLTGHFPCGWEGDFPKGGRLIVF